MSVSSIILCKDEGYNIIDCINSLKDYLDEIIIVDSSDDLVEYSSMNLVERIVKDIGCGKCVVHKVKIGDKGVGGIDDLRNFGNSVSVNDWTLHVDVDEIFSDSFLKNIDSTVGGNRWCYKFPRINLPFYERYPDYQIRLMNKKHCEWKGVVHEKVMIFDEPHEIGVLDEYPIIHMRKVRKEDKLDVNRRWNLMKKDKVLIVSLFNQCEKWIDRFFLCLNEMIKWSKCDIDIMFVEGKSTDNTYIMLSKWIEKRTKNEKDKYKYNLVKMEIGDNVKRLERLAILRNIAVKLGIDKKDYDYVLMIDSDIIFEKDLLMKLIEDVKIGVFNVVAPLIFIENFRLYGDSYLYDTFAFKKGNENFQHFFPYLRGLDENMLKESKFIEVDSVGSCYLVRGEVYNINDYQDYNIVKCYKEGKLLSLYEGKGETEKSEQVGFFENVKKMGYRIGVDTSIKILHVNLEKLGIKWH